MTKRSGVEYATTGHQEILASIQQKHQLDIEQTFSSDHTVCTLATTPDKQKVFVKVKGYKKNKANEGKFRRAVTSNRMAGRMQTDIMPRWLEFRAFERDGVLWLATLSAFGGEPMSSGLFFGGNTADVDDRTIERIGRALRVIAQTPSSSFFYDPPRIAQFIKGAFGKGVTAVASEWTSAHCDFHWANILTGGKHVIDWDMFALAPKGFDAASIVLFSSSDMALFERMHHALADLLDNPSARVATRFAAARILRLMQIDTYAGMRPHEGNLRKAVDIMLHSNARG